MHWFYRDWWRYLLAPRMAGYSWLEVVWCRLHGHPPGPIYYTHASATEPDWHCKGCGDHIG